MPASFLRLPVALLLLPVFLCRGWGEEVPLTLTSPAGATLRFAAETEATWSWAGLTTPEAEEEQGVLETPGSVIVNGTEVMLVSAWFLTEQTDERLVFEQVVPEANLAVRRIYSFGPAPQVARIETWARSLAAEQLLSGVSLLDVRFAGEEFRETGEAPASFPLLGRGLFVGLEHVSGNCRTGGDSAHLWQAPRLKLGGDWFFVAAAVVGWTRPDGCSLLTGEARIRDAFVQYLDTIRLKPADLELHTNTWWSLPVTFTETDALRHLEALRQGFFARTGMFFDSFALDLGWSDPKSVWQVAANRFPTGFRTIDERLRGLGARMGLWASPGSAYPTGLDNHWLVANGYEISPYGPPEPDFPGAACFALGTKYQRDFKENLLRLVRDYGMRHVKLDFMVHRCDVASHGHPVGEDSGYAIDAGLADVLDSLRALNPDIVLEPLCTGYPPSPWWLTKTPYVLGPHGDDVPYGRVPSPEWMESLISARDIPYRQDQERWLMSTQALETFDIVVQSPGQFENLAVMAIGRGRWFISTYLKPELMTPQNWDFLAELVRWARANKSYLGNTISFGGNPAAREPYGYLFHHPTKDIYCARNPWIETNSIPLPHCANISEARELRMIYPRREIIARLQPGDPDPSLLLGPYETVMIESVPLGEDSPPVTVPAPPDIVVENSTPLSVELMETDDDAGTSQENLQLLWSGQVTIPNLPNAELCVLVESDPMVELATCSIAVDGRAVTARAVASAGQFGAAALPSPENWKWFLVPMTAGTHQCQVFIDTPTPSAAVGVYLRGRDATASAPAPEQGAVFPVWRPTERPWSATLLALKTYDPAASPDPRESTEEP